MSVKRRAWFGDVYERGVVGQNRYAITFDDGPLEGATDDILDILKQHAVPATFFVIGQNAARSPKLIERMASEGHIIANHTWSHWRLSMFCPSSYWVRELRRTDEIIHSIIGKTPAMFRPPMAVRTPSNSKAMRITGHACVMWTRRAMDGVATTKERVLNRLVGGLDDGAVLLLHDGREAASRRDPRPTIEALPALLEAARDRSLKPTPLDELLDIAAYRDGAV